MWYCSVLFLNRLLSNGISEQVAKQWYDFERSSFHFVKLAKELKSPLTFRRVMDFDDNGIMYWIGSNAKYAHHLSLVATISSRYH